jgi:hypothetical protein
MKKHRDLKEGKPTKPPKIEGLLASNHFAPW